MCLGKGGGNCGIRFLTPIFKIFVESFCFEDLEYVSIFSFTADISIFTNSVVTAGKHFGDVGA
jgi:hypothetical protein